MSQHNLNLSSLDYALVLVENALKAMVRDVAEGDAQLSELEELFKCKNDLLAIKSHLQS